MQNPIPSPIVVKRFFSGETLLKIQEYVNNLKEKDLLKKDDQFKRRYLKDDPFFHTLHHGIVNYMSQDFFNTPVKPSYSFLSIYNEGDGECSPHFDRPECQFTVDICLNQKRPWPLSVNDREEFKNKNLYELLNSTDERPISKEEMLRMKETSTPYILEPGDALCFAGGHFSHWRERIDQGNFCDLIFFHFAPKDFDFNYGK